MRFEEAEKCVELVFDRQLHVIVKQSRWGDRLQLCVFIIFFGLTPAHSLFSRVEVMNLNELSIFAEVDAG